jgi:hypothetical protein
MQSRTILSTSIPRDVSVKILVFKSSSLDPFFPGLLLLVLFFLVVGVRLDRSDFCNPN